MAKPKAVLIIGGSGFVGTHLAQRLRDNYRVFSTFSRRSVAVPGVTPIPMELSNEKWTKQVIFNIEPDVIIYAAGDHNAEAYDEKDGVNNAERLFAAGPLHSATAAHMVGARYFYVSSALVYDGQRGNYRETDLVSPDRNLGKAKVGGENFIKGKSSNWVIVRPSPLLGRANGYHLSFMDKLRMALDRGQRFEVANDYQYSFATAPGFAELVERLIETGVRNKTYHYGGLTKATMLEMSRSFANHFGYDSKLLVPKRRKDGLTDEQAKRDYSVNSSQMAEVLKIKPLLLEESLDLIEKQLISRA